MLYKKITPHLVARYRASPGPAEKRRRGERVAGLTRTPDWGRITRWRSGKEWGTSSHAPRVESEGRRPGKGTVRGSKPPYLRQAHTVRRAESDGAAPCRIKKVVTAQTPVEVIFAKGSLAPFAQRLTIRISGKGKRKIRVLMKVLSKGDQDLGITKSPS